MTANEIREAYNKRSLLLFFNNVVSDNVEPVEGEVQEYEAMKALHSMPEESNDFGDLVPAEIYEDWTASEILEAIEDISSQFINFDPEAS